ncbi:MAG TPA: serine/threonine-protein kinase [Planctomycetota bacterium]|nr:serine/threonine-protein kinase [Planctomycetota bacterium]
MQEESLFGKIAVEEGYLSQAELETATRDSQGKALTEVLLNRGLLSDSQVQIIRDIQRIHMAEVSAPAESGGMLRQDRFMLPCSGCDTYYLIQGYPEGTKFVCRKCQKILVVRRVAEAPTPARSATPRAIGPYDLLGEVGRGSMSVVYKARNRETGAIVAVKVLKESDSPNPQFLRRFQQEARAASRLSHPGIVPVLDSGEKDGIYYIAMAAVEGVTLDRALSANRLSLRQFVEVLEQVALAVHHAHEQGIVHRDLKPANIILDAGGRPHVTDFGLAKMEHLEKAATQGGGTIGTPWYMSPEQVIGDVRGTDARSDIYALGVLLYEGLTGKVPFPGSSVVQVYLGILNGTVTPPSEINPRTPRDLEAICLQALDRDKTRRQPSALEFALELRHHLEPPRKAHGA